MRKLTKIYILFTFILAAFVNMSASVSASGNGTPLGLHESPVYKAPGQNTVWDFSDSTNTSGFTKFMELFRKDGHYVLNLGYVEYVGNFRHFQENELFLLRAFNAESDSVNTPLMRYNESCPGGIVAKSQGGDKWSVVKAENAITTADGLGTLILPDGDTLCNVVRLKTVYDVTGDVMRKYYPGEDAAKTVRLSTYEWYSPDCSYPLFAVNAFSIPEGSDERDLYTEAYYCSNKALLFYEEKERIRKAKEEAGIMLRYSSENWPVSNVEIEVKGRKACISFDSTVDKGNVILLFCDSKQGPLDYKIETPINVGKNKIHFKLPKLTSGRNGLALTFRGVGLPVYFDVE